MIKAGVTVHRATAPFSAGGKQYPAGSYVVQGGAGFRPHVLDMFEPQDHPNDFQFPGGPPIPPYDNAGWTLAFQMGVKFDRVLEGVDGPLERIADVMKPAAGQVSSAQARRATSCRHRLNDAFTAVNRLLKAGEEVYFVGDRRWQSQDGTGVIFITAKPSTARGAAEGGGRLRPDVHRRDRRVPRARCTGCTKPRIGLWDQYGGSMPSGHVRWLLEQFEFPFEVVYPADARRRQPEGEVRRAALPRRRHPGETTAAAASAASARSRAPRTCRRNIRVAARPRDGQADDSAVEALRRRGRRDRRVRRIGGARSSPRPAGERSPGRDAAGRQRAAAAGHQVLHPRLDPARRGGQHQSARRTASTSRWTCSSTTAR